MKTQMKLWLASAEWIIVVPEYVWTARTRLM
jgi:hypothetical protein